MNFLRVIIVLIPLTILFGIGLLCAFITLVVGIIDDGCRRLFKKLYPGK